MRETEELTHEFIETFPEELEEGKLYVSIKYRSAAHKCCCGCGRKVITPISPVGWTLSFNGKAISLEPSIGNFTFPCKSHYFITKNKVRWAKNWSEEEIDEAREFDAASRERYYQSQEVQPIIETKIKKKKGQKQRKGSVLKQLKNWIKPE